MKKYILLGLVLFFAAQPRISAQQALPHTSILRQMMAPSPNQVLVVAHRGDWRNAPENSLRAVTNCIAMGVDIVEIDIKISRDSQLIVMHDKTLDRTTTGKGLVKDWPLDSIKTLFLKNALGQATLERVPTLRETMLAVKGKPVLVNLDKAWDYLPQTFALLKETGTLDQGIFKGVEPVSQMRQKFGALMDSIHYMPMVYPASYRMYEGTSNESPKAYVERFTKEINVAGFEVIVDSEQSSTLEVIRILNKKHISVWINTLWNELCAGHTDELAQDDPDAHWGWVIRNGANIIQTDRPQLLLTYLRSKGLHP
jgi:glycerophosphoryl diester phosphodiesterase